MSTKKILISGAGIAGLVLARQFKKFNIPFKLIEKKAELTTQGAGIALPANAVKALRYIGLGEQIEKQTHRVSKIIYADSTGAILSESSLLDPPLNSDWFVALHRSKFQDMLCEGLKDDICFGTTISAMDASQQGITVTFDGPEKKTEEFSAVVGADGVNSRVRKLAFSDPPLTDLGITIWRWTCQYPTDHLEPTYMFSARDVYMAYPIAKNEVYCYAHVFDPDNLYAQAADSSVILKERFAHYGGIAKIFFGMLPENRSVISGRLRSIMQPHFTKDAFALIGDAAHVCATFLQQGAACAMEDAIVLAELLKQFPVDKALTAYKHFRHERVNWIVSSSNDATIALIRTGPELFPEIYKKIRENGPLNVQGWKKLLAADPLKELSSYVEDITEAATHNNQPYP